MKTRRQLVKLLKSCEGEPEQDYTSLESDRDNLHSALEEVVSKLHYEYGEIKTEHRESLPEFMMNWPNFLLKTFGFFVALPCIILISPFAEDSLKGLLIEWWDSMTTTYIYLEDDK